MTRVDPGQRKKAYKPKTRTGCLTLRRVKCDEGKPACTRCSSTGRKCDGYPDQDEARIITPRSRSTSITKSPPPEILSSKDECQAFQFFLLRTAPQLSGLYGCEFWDQLVLQATHHETAIRHAIIALGALHCRFENGDLLPRSGSVPLDQDSFALQQYGLAIKHLIHPFSVKDGRAVDVCLIACILFACFEMIQGHFGSAITHVTSGVKILWEIQGGQQHQEHHGSLLSTSLTPYVSTGKLKELFTRLDGQVTQLLGRHQWNTYSMSANESPLSFRMPTSFSTLSQARDALEHHWNKYISSQTEMAQRLPSNLALYQALRKQYIDLLQQWTRALDGFVKARGDTLTTKEQAGVATLLIYQRLYNIVLHIERSPVDDQTRWDKYCPEFEEIVSLARSIIEPSPSTTPSDTAQQSAVPSPTRRNPTFSLDMGIIGPLYDVSSSCRHPAIRRSAVAVLRSAARQEGLWNGALTALVAERVIQLEEEGLGEVRTCADVPDWARLSDVRPTFDPDGKRAVLRYSRRSIRGGGGVVGRTAREEVLVW